MSLGSNIAYLTLVFPEVPQAVLDLALFCTDNNLDKAMDGLLRYITTLELHGLDIVTPIIRYSENQSTPDSAKKRKGSNAADTSFTPEKKGKVCFKLHNASSYVHLDITT